MSSADAEHERPPAVAGQAPTADTAPAPAQTPGLVLEVIAGNAAGADIGVHDELVIGRHATGAGQLSEDTEISRQHARLSREVTGDYAIEDLGSSNGTFVNGLRLAAPRILEEGDSIEVGATTLLVRSITGRAAAEPPPPAPGAAATVFAQTPADADTPAPGAAATVYARTPAPAPEDAPAPGAAATVYARTPAPAPEDAPAPGAAATVYARASPPAEAPASGPQVPRLKLVLEVDLEAREATIALGDDADPLRLVLEDGRWRTPGAGD
jgi:pSer/pThr/pTyr-binding forkhead associated (FHA) protein